MFQRGQSDTTIPVVRVPAEYGWNEKVRLDVPIIAEAMVCNATSRQDGEDLATRAALAGMTLVCGENLCGFDPELQQSADGSIVRAPELDRQIETYQQYHRGLGEIVVRISPEDTRLTVPEYVLESHGVDAVELTMASGEPGWARRGEEPEIDSIGLALRLQRRGHTIIPDPSKTGVCMAFQSGVITRFERHGRLGFVDQGRFLSECERLRRLGFRRILLNATGVSRDAAAMAITWASKGRIDLLTLDALPAIIELAQRLADEGRRVPDLALVGDFGDQDDPLSSLVVGAPFCKAVRMGGRAPFPPYGRGGPVSTLHDMSSHGIGNAVTSASVPRRGPR